MEESEINTKLSRKYFWAIVANSTTAYILAFLSVFYLNHFLKILLTGLFDYPITFTYDTIYFLIENYEWTHDSVRLIYSAGPLLMLVLGIISLVLFINMSDEPGRMKIFFVWFSLHAFNFVFSGLVIGNILTYGIGHVFNWMYLHDTMKMLVALIGFFGLLLSAIVVTKPIATSALSYFNRLDENNSPFFIMSQIIVPFLLGAGTILVFFLPEIPIQEKYSWIVLGVLLIIVSGRINSMEPMPFDLEERKVGVSWPVLIFTIVVLLALRFGLENSISISWGG